MMGSAESYFAAFAVFLKASTAQIGLMGDLVPEARRGRYFALRTRLSSLANFSALIVAGFVLHDLGFSYVAFMFNTAASMCVQFLTLNRWGRLSDLFGNRLILVATGLVIPLLPSLRCFCPGSRKSGG